MKAAAIYQSAAQNILRDASFVASVSPRATFPIDVLRELNPAKRICWDVDTVIISAFCGGGSPGEPRQGDILVIPMANFQLAGSPSSLTLTNGAGLVQSLTPPDLLENGLPKTLVVDLTIDTPDPDDRTSSVWHLHVTGNAFNLTLGAAFAIYSPKSYLVDRDFQWGYREYEEGACNENSNSHLTQNVVDLRTSVRGLEVSMLASEFDAATLRASIRACNGRGQVGFLWFDPDIADGYLGRWQKRLTTTHVFNEARQFDLVFEELSKGYPLLNTVGSV